MNGLDKMAFTDLFQELNALCNAGNKDLSIHKGSKDNTTIGDITGQLYPPLKYGEAYENIKSEAKVYIFNLSTLIRLKPVIVIFNISHQLIVVFVFRPCFIAKQRSRN